MSQSKLNHDWLHDSRHGKVQPPDLPHHWIAQAVLMPLILMLLALGVFSARFNVFSAQPVELGEASATSEVSQ